MGFGRDFLRGTANYLDPRGLQAIDRADAARRQAQADSLQQSFDNKIQLTETRQVQLDSFLKNILPNVSPENKVQAIKQSGFEDVLLKTTKQPFEAESFPGEQPLEGNFNNPLEESLIGQARPSRKDLSKLGKMRAELTDAQLRLDQNPNDARLQNQVKSANDGINKEVNITKLFESTEKKEFIKIVADNREKAKSARKSIITANNMLDTLNRGVITGAFSDLKLNLSRVMKAAGLPHDDRLSDTEQFKAIAGQATLNILGSGVVGAGTGISDNDVIFVQKVVAGDTGLDENSMRRILRINAIANEYILDQHNLLADKVGRPKFWKIDTVKFKGSRDDLESGPLQPDQVIQPQAPKAEQGLSPVNAKGWKLLEDAQGNKAYVGPNGEIEEVR